MVEKCSKYCEHCESSRLVKFCQCLYIYCVQAGVVYGRLTFVDTPSLDMPERRHQASVYGHEYAEQAGKTSVIFDSFKACVRACQKRENGGGTYEVTHTALSAIDAFLYVCVVEGSIESLCLVRVHNPQKNTPTGTVQENTNDEIVKGFFPRFTIVIAVLSKIR